MQLNEVVIPMSEVSDKFVVNIRLSGLGMFKFRTAIAVAFLRVASWIAPFTVEIKD